MDISLLNILRLEPSCGGVINPSPCQAGSVNIPQKAMKPYITRHPAAAFFFTEHSIMALFLQVSCRICDIQGASHFICQIKPHLLPVTSCGGEMVSGLITKTPAALTCPTPGFLQLLPQDFINGTVYFPVKHRKGIMNTGRVFPCRFPVNPCLQQLPVPVIPEFLFLQYAFPAFKTKPEIFPCLS